MPDSFPTASCLRNALTPGSVSTAHFFLLLRGAPLDGRTSICLAILLWTLERFPFGIILNKARSEPELRKITNSLSIFRGHPCHPLPLPTGTVTQRLEFRRGEAARRSAYAGKLCALSALLQEDQPLSGLPCSQDLQPSPQDLLSGSSKGSRRGPRP